ncbi:hypothetical protein FCR2A7T_07800 [Flavobacterium cauense R2A-7]|uniref:Uncharacterized protein n=1 Tax=Flavobacterium cauense R2A-7 TaxID=1341154 RepID=V6S420_9FLAO|nr:hypothetical protein [Flavobacterium cauense]ESU21007.1 hypothetical protein FCR2A7T_07800 [Flavobacterium cauense R2A-7]KGO78587.1 hypothetical protein Q762_15120 [Flavobacterium cauense R2A-7]TWI08324.1 hypothetical protein IP98_02744 [Flavobacterium cauense R2A-7]
MKKSIIYSGIALLTFTNVITALAQQSFLKDEGLTQTVAANKLVSSNKHNSNPFEKRNGNDNETPATSNEETILVPVYEKTIEEIIAENNRIIESNLSTEEYREETTTEDFPIIITAEESPVNYEKVMEERILQDNQIIESQLSNAVTPIDPRKSN